MRIFYADARTSSYIFQTDVRSVLRISDFNLNLCLPNSVSVMQSRCMPHGWQHDVQTGLMSMTSTCLKHRGGQLFCPCLRVR